MRWCEIYAQFLLKWENLKGQSSTLHLWANVRNWSCLYLRLADIPSADNGISSTGVETFRVRIVTQGIYPTSVIRLHRIPDDVRNIQLRPRKGWTPPCMSHEDLFGYPILSLLLVEPNQVGDNCSSSSIYAFPRRKTSLQLRWNCDIALILSFSQCQQSACQQSHCSHTFSPFPRYPTQHKLQMNSASHAAYTPSRRRRVRDPTI